MLYLLVFNDVHYSRCNDTTDGVATKSIKVGNPCFLEAVGNVSRRNHRRNGESVTHGFSERDNVGHNVLSLQLKRPPVSTDSTKADLDLVGNANAARIPDMLVNFPEVIWRRDDLSSTTLQALSDEAAWFFAFRLHLFYDVLHVLGIFLPKILTLVVLVPIELE